MISSNEVKIERLSFLKNKNTIQKVDKTLPSQMFNRIHVRMILMTTILLSSIMIVSADWIDIDTPLDKRTTTSLVDGSIYHLVMSDEFNVDNRTFGDGDDPVWTALDKSDDDASSVGGGSMHFYNSTNVKTEDGYLKIATLLAKTEWNRYDTVTKEWKHEVTNFTSGMVQSWEKFCFTGGIVEVDVIFPGDPYIGGLWPAVWMLGNLGRATYEASTNNIWPWSYDTCDRSLQKAQTISACNKENHFGMKPNQGRGATEIDIIEVMTGSLTGGLIGTNPPIDYPYGDFTLQVAPGVVSNRPQSGRAPLRKNVISSNGHTEFFKDTWYDGLEMNGNTSVNPFFYGTYLAETKPNEPVTRTKEQAFQADAVGAAHQLTPSHFEKPHTFRLEWQPGPGGRLDWYVRNHKIDSTTMIEGDGTGQDWLHAYSMKDESLQKLMGSQIPIEPTYLIFNVAVSSTWGFPYDVPEYCPKCYDCDDPKCACSFYPGFCQMLRSKKTAMYIDNVRVYQSRDDTAHVGAPHTLGCDPPDYPTKEWIKGHEYRYMRNPPFSYFDKHPLRKVKNGGGSCTTDSDCGSEVNNLNLTSMYEQQQTNNATTTTTAGGRRQLQNEAAEIVVEVQEESTPIFTGRGTCQVATSRGIFGPPVSGKVCVCQSGYTGPNCMSLDHVDDSPKAILLSKNRSPFARVSNFRVPGFMFGTLLSGAVVLLYILFQSVQQNKRFRMYNNNMKAAVVTDTNNHLQNRVPSGVGSSQQSVHYERSVLNNNNKSTATTNQRR